MSDDILSGFRRCDRWESDEIQSDEPFCVNCRWSEQLPYTSLYICENEKSPLFVGALDTEDPDADPFIDEAETCDYFESRGLDVDGNDDV